MNTTRRQFLQGSLATAATLALPARLRAQSEGANSDIRVAIIGFNGRGNAHIAGYRNKDGSPKKGVRIVALCDVDTKVLEKGKAQLAAKNITVETYQDIRKLLESKEVDAISIATPNHWHALGAIWGCQAGKDVYVEKPVSHNVWEGRQLVKAAEKYNRVVQMGVQSRSAAGLAAAVKFAKGGSLGKLLYARGLCYKPRPSIGKVDKPQPVPETVDYDLWCGPAPKLPIMRTKFHYDWHWFWATGNGDLGNQGIHQMDIARRFLGEQALAPKVFSIGGRLGYVDDGETPNSQVIFHDYEKAPLIFEVRGLPEKTGSKAMDKYRKVSVGVIVQFENGHIECPNYSDAYIYDKDGNQVQKLDGKSAPDWGTEDHFENFIDCVRSRKVADLNGKILDGHISSALCHTGNISHLLGKKMTPDEMREKIKGNKQATESFERLAAHMEANGVDLKVDKLTMGEFLAMDPKTENFIGNKAADKLLTRDYRKPYVVPAKV